MNEVDTKQTLFEVNLQLSRYLLFLLLACLGAAYTALWLCALPLIIKIMIGFLVAAYAGEYYCLYIGLSHKRSIRAVRLINNQWLIRQKEGWYRAWPSGEVVVTSGLICCRMKVDGVRHPSYLMLMADSAVAEELHALRLKLMLDAHRCL